MVQRPGIRVDSADFHHGHRRRTNDRLRFSGARGQGPFDNTITDLWQHCLDRLGREIPNQQFNTWIRPLHCMQDDNRLRLMALNAFVLDWVKNYLDRPEVTLMSWVTLTR